MKRRLGKQATIERTRYPGCKVFLLRGREMKRVLKSLESWSLKNTINFGVSVFSPFDMYLSFMASIMFCTEMKVLGPVEQPKSATHIGFRDPERVLMSK